jgi:hypothetical protein
MRLNILGSLRRSLWFPVDREWLLEVCQLKRRGLGAVRDGLDNVGGKASRTVREKKTG